MTGSEEFQIVDSSAHDGFRSGDRLDRIREIYQNETCKSAIDRTRRAESNAKALEAILEAQVDEVSQSVAGTPPTEELFMELEDTRARLVYRLKELESLRSQVAELRSQQSIDDENIESLQQSLERLHRVAGEYRTDRDNLSSQLIEFFNVVKNSGSDPHLSMEDLRAKLGDRQLVLMDPLSAQDQSGVVAELEAAIAEKDAIIASVEFSAKNLQDQIETLKSQMEAQRIAKESLEAELVHERSQLAEYETKINEWSDWAATVTSDLESRNKEIELLEKFKEHAAEEIEILEERVKELSSVSPPPPMAVDPSELAELNSRIADWESEKNELENKIYEWSEWADSMTTSLDERGTEVEALKARLTEESEFRTLWETVKAEKLEIFKELESVRQTVAELKLQLNAKEDAIGELKSVQDDLRRAEAKIANLNDQLQISENLVNGTAEQLELEKSAIEVARDELRAKLAVRNATVSALTREIDALKKSSVPDNSVELKRIQALEAELVHLRDQQLVSGEREQDVHRLRAEIAMINEESERLNNRIGELQDSNNQLEEELEETRVYFRAKEAELLELENRQPEIDETVLADQRKGFELRVGELEREKDSMREEIDRLENQMNENTMRETALVEQVSELEKKLNEWTVWSEESQRETAVNNAELVQLRSQLDESAVVADRLREQIKMLEENMSGVVGESGSLDIVRLETERADMEQKLIAWNKWADEVTAQLAERDATIADLMSGRDHLDESLRQAEELRRRVAELESTAVEREKSLADDSPIGRRLDGGGTDDLAKAHAEIAELRKKLEKAAIEVPRTNSPGVVSSEEAEVLLEAYRAEIDRLSKENSKLRTEVKKTTSSAGETKPAATSSNSWWNILPDIEETDDSKQ